MNFDAFRGYKIGQGSQGGKRDPITVHMAMCQLTAEVCKSDRHACPVCKAGDVTEMHRTPSDQGVKITYRHGDGKECEQATRYEK